MAARSGVGSSYFSVAIRGLLNPARDRTRESLLEHYEWIRLTNLKFSANFDCQTFSDDFCKKHVPAAVAKLVFRQVSESVVAQANQVDQRLDQN